MGSTSGFPEITDLWRTFASEMTCSCSFNFFFSVWRKLFFQHVMQYVEGTSKSEWEKTAYGA